MTLHSGERQVAPKISGIRRDHVARYEWAAAKLVPGAVLDLACGVGYGTRILAEAGHRATGWDRSHEAITYARLHYAHPNAHFEWTDAASLSGKVSVDAAVCFETIEHIEDPLPLLKSLRAAAPILLASVPNEEVMPFGSGYAFHFRHYTKGQFAGLLKSAGWKVMEWWGQLDDASEVEPDVMGRTLIAVCVHGGFEESEPESERIEKPQAPDHVSIVGLGPSSAQYVDICKRLGGRHRYCDETWGINALGDVIACDRIFHMDDVRVQEVRAEAAPESNIAAMLEWLKTHPGPIVTSRAVEGYPGLVEFPLEEVVNDCPNGYFNSTAAYAVAYAVYLGVKKISLWGCDFTYPNAHDAEKGRACVEFWLGVAAERGIKLTVPKSTTLLDALHTQAERFYGYDMVDLDISRKDGRIAIGFIDRAETPSAEEMEHRYDHSRPANALVEAGHIEAPDNRAAARAPEVK
jgi:SAM-dependent methyltransferase